MRVQFSFAGGRASSRRTVVRVAIVATATLVAASCGQQQQPQMGTPEVGVVVLHPESVTLTADLAGRTTPYVISEVRPQVNGIVKSRLFKEGENVKAGQVLYEIDPATYQAAVDVAKAQVANAVASLKTLQLKAQRSARLVQSGWVSKETNDDAQAAWHQAEANVAQQRANLQSAIINLGYTRLVAPIAGRIGVSTVTPGALVTANQTTALTTIQTLDPIYVDVQQSSAELLALRRAVAAGKLLDGKAAAAEVSLRLEDGTTYGQKGKLELTDVTVDQSTGAVTLRAVFPNPDGVLLPGMYVRAIVAEGVANGVILAPQQGVSRNEKGEPTAFVVDADGKAQLRVLKTDRVIGDRWLVSSGLGDGDRLIVEGLLKVHPGAQVNAVPAGSPPKDQAAPSGPKG